MQLGNNIYNLRKEKGLSQEKLAEKINVTRQTISNWELGETYPNPEQLILLSKELNQSIDKLVGNDVETLDHKENTDCKSNIKAVYISLSIIIGLIAGVWAFAANRFRFDEILLIALAGMAVGICLGVVCHNALRYLKNKTSN